MKKLILIAVMTLVNIGNSQAEIGPAPLASALQEKYTSLKERLNHNQFKLPLYIDSRQKSGDLQGDVYAVVSHPFSTVSASVKNANQWCDILFLHLNVKYCRAADKQGSQLTVYVGRKYDQPLDAAHRVEFAFKAVADDAQYFQIALNAKNGPLGTKNYRIMLEAIPLEGQTFIHLTYSYGYGMMAKLATDAYFSTSGSDKVGFTITGKSPDGKPIYVRDMRGVLERNTMRYYLAIDAYLDTLSTPPADQLEKRLQHWFTSTERYALQLHEVTESEYLNMKRKEYKRQQTTSPNKQTKPD